MDDNGSTAVMEPQAKATVKPSIRTDTIFNVPKRFVELCACAAKENYRYGIGGVMIERGKDGRIIGAVTDGHRLVVAAAPDLNGSGTNKAIISTGLFKMLAKMLTGDTFRLVVKSDGTPSIEVPTLYGNAVMTSGFVIGVPFPPYRDVIPKYEPNDTTPNVFVNSSLAPSTMACMGAILKSCEGPAAISWRSKAENKPVLLRARRDGVDVVGVLMPCASNERIDVFAAIDFL